MLIFEEFFKKLLPQNPTWCYLSKALKKQKAGIAQLVEQWTENPRVTSSNLVPGIKTKRVGLANSFCFYAV